MARQTATKMLGRILKDLRLVTESQIQEAIALQPLGSLVDFFNGSVADGFKGSITLTCDAPVVAVAVNQDSANSSFPTDRLTIKGLN